MQSPAPQYNNQVGGGPSPQPGPSSNDLGPMPPSRAEEGTKVSGFGIWEGCHIMFLLFDIYTVYSMFYIKTKLTLFNAYFITKTTSFQIILTSLYIFFQYLLYPFKLKILRLLTWLMVK